MKAIVWIDQTTAKVITVDAAGDTAVWRIKLDAAPALHDMPPNRHTDEQAVGDFVQHIARYFERIIAILDAADSVYLMGADVAKHTLRQLLERDTRHATTIMVDRDFGLGNGEMLLRHRIEHTTTPIAPRLH